MADEIVFPAGEEPKKLENFLKKRFPIGYVRKLFRKSGLKLNGKRCHADDMAYPGDRIQLFIRFQKQIADVDPRAHNVEIVFEDEELLIINKPAGMAVHEGKGILKRRSLIGILEAVYRPRGIHPRLVHRIDRNTSGLLIVAKTEERAAALETQFKKGEIEKEYLALVSGRTAAKEGKIDFALPGRDQTPVSALTLYSVEKEFAGASLVRVKTKSGRMHQIRLHFSGLGHPVVMDSEHGDFAFNKSFRKTYGLDRQFLHAVSIALDYRGKRRRWSAGLPNDLAETLELLNLKRRVPGLPSRRYAR